MTEVFGAAGPIVGTLVSAVLALLFALPVAFGRGGLPGRVLPEGDLRRPIGIAVELLAGIPSIVYGMWGLFVFAPFFAAHVAAAADDGDAPPGSLLGDAGPRACRTAPTSSPPRSSWRS